MRIRQDVKNAIGAFENIMLNYAIAFFIIALIAGLFGFNHISSSAAGISEILFYVFIALAIASFLLGLMRST